MAASVALEHGDWKSALRALSAMEAETGATVELRRLMGAYEAAGNAEALERTAREAVSLSPEDSRLRADAAAALLRVGRCRAAANLAEELLVRWPDRPLGRSTLIRALSHCGELEKADRLAREAQDTWPDRREFAIAAARVALDRGHWDRVHRIVASAEEFHGALPSLRKIRIEALSRAAEPEAAEHLADEAVREWPDDLSLAKIHVRVPLLLERWEEAIERAERLVARWPDDEGAWRIPAEVAVPRKRWPGGYVPPVSEAEALAATQPAGPESACSIVRALSVEGRLDEAEARCADAREQWPDDDLLSAHISRISGIRRAVALGNAACDHFPETVYFVCRKVLLFLRFHWRAEAVDLARASIGRWPESGEVRHVYLFALEAGGLVDEAIGYVREIFRNGSALTESLLNDVARVARAGKFRECLALIRSMEASAAGEDRDALEVATVYLLRASGFFEDAWRLANQVDSQSADIQYMRYKLGLMVAKDVGGQSLVVSGETLRRERAEVISNMIASGEFDEARKALDLSNTTLGFYNDLLNLSYMIESKSFDAFERHLPRILAFVLSDSRASFVVRMAKNDPQLADRLRATPQAPEVDRACAEVSSDHLYRYEEIRRYAEDIRGKLAASYVDPDLPISLVCPVHRRGDLGRLAETLRAQEGAGRIEAIICFNNCDVAAGSEELKAVTGWLRMPITIMDCGAVPLGCVMNLGMERADGEILCKIDADNVYFPEYIEKVRAYFAALDPALLYQSSAFTLFDEQNILAYGPRVPDEYGHARGCKGGTICVKKQVWESVRWEDGLVKGEDVSFVHRCRALGHETADCDPFGYVTIRGKNEGHSHKISPLQLLSASDYILGDRGCVGMAALGPLQG